jgi:hypothetical protein
MEILKLYWKRDVWDKPATFLRRQIQENHKFHKFKKCENDKLEDCQEL